MRNKILSGLFWFVIVIGLTLSILGFSLLDWYNLTFGISFEELLFTITSPLDGSDVSFMNEAVAYVLPTAVKLSLVFVMFIVIAIIFSKVKVYVRFTIGKCKIKFKVYHLYKIAIFLFTVAYCCTTIGYCDDSLQISEYIRRKMQKTTIYEEYYVKPSEDMITLEGEEKNVIYIYLESMESTYASTEDGGALQNNYIPRLTELAKQNISFSHNDRLGGSYSTSGTKYTMASLFATTAGIPYSFPIHGNQMDKYDKFVPGVVTFGDILGQKGYNQVFLCGSMGNFAGRQTYFEQHGGYQVMDYVYADVKDYIPDGYSVWWGYEDEYLYEIAKKELTQLATKDEPFNFTMLTVDTHHVDGYVCNNCTEKYPDQLGNVLECADEQVAEFVSWCKQQDFYEDTVIVITGDHLRMDTALVGGIEERRVYNCIINSDTQIEGNSQNRIFTPMDMLPTVLAAMGYEIEGDRLGLGTNLFSDKQTLAEEMGIETFDYEISKYSEYYEKNFR